MLLNQICSYLIIIHIILHFQHNYITTKEADALLLMSDKVIKDEALENIKPPERVDPQMWRVGFLFTKLLHVVNIFLEVTGLHDKLVIYI